MATIAELKEKFNKALLHVNRTGIDGLIYWLENSTDFFSAPASSRFHGNYQGGLLEHSLHVLEFSLVNLNWMLKYKPELEESRESLIIAALFHDVCKINQYIWGDEQFTKINDGTRDRWAKYQTYKFEDKFPMGHGEKSVYYISKHIVLTTSEVLAIRWHMGYSEPGTQFDGLTKYAYQTASQDPLVKIIHAADVVSVIAADTVDYKSNAKIV